MFYFLMVINTLLAITFVTIGFINGIGGSQGDSIFIGTKLFFGFWNFLFAFVGFYGMCKRNKDYINYVSIF